MGWGIQDREVGNVKFYGFYNKIDRDVFQAKIYILLCKTSRFITYDFVTNSPKIVEWVSNGDSTNDGTNGTEDGPSIFN